MRVSGTLERNWPTSPAEWKVEPLVSSLRSSSTTSRSPSLARWWAIEAPPTPPPTMTTRARSGSSRALATVLLPCAPVRAPGRTCGGEPFLELRLLDGGAQALEVRARVAIEVEVQLGNLRLQDAPGGLARVGEDAHQRERRAAPVRRRFAVVGAQQALVVGFAEVVVDGQVAEVEAGVAHAGVLPVDDQQPAVVARADDVAGEQVVVAGARAPRRQGGGDARGDGGRLAVLTGSAYAARTHPRAVLLEQVGNPEARGQHRRGVVEAA